MEIGRDPQRHDLRLPFQGQIRVLHAIRGGARTKGREHGVAIGDQGRAGIGLGRRGIDLAWRLGTWRIDGAAVVREREDLGLGHGREALDLDGAATR
jgi:hypothetical protein